MAEGKGERGKGRRHRETERENVADTLPSLMSALLGEEDIVVFVRLFLEPFMVMVAERREGQREESREERRALCV